MDTMNDERPGEIRSQHAEGILRVSVDNQRRYNAMSLAMWESLGRIIAEAQDRSDIRLIVLSGAGEKAFVSGADISEFGEKRSDPANIARYAEAVDNAQAGLRNSRIPTIAAVQGICYGGGMGLALSCDLRFASTESRFRMPAARLGLGYALPGVKRFVDMLGAAVTADLFLTSRTFDGAEAARIGFVHEVFTAETFDRKIAERTDAMSGYAPLTMEALKLSLRHLMGGGGAPTSGDVEAAVARCFASEDYKEGQKAFAEKRPAQFRGR